MDGEPSSRSDPTEFHVIKILLDTNFLLLPFQRRIDIFEEIKHLVEGQVKFLILPQILKELKILEDTGTAKERHAAKVSHQLIERHCHLVEISNTPIEGLDADSALLHYAQETGAIVATNDRELRQNLVKQGSRAIFLRKLAVLALTD